MRVISNAQSSRSSCGARMQSLLFFSNIFRIGLAREELCRCDLFQIVAPMKMFSGGGGSSNGGDAGYTALEVFVHLFILL